MGQELTIPSRGLTMYEGPHTLAERCFSEFAATALMMFLGLGTLGNELLAKTKGQGMGCAPCPLSQMLADNMDIRTSQH